MSKQATITEIARKAGVSIGTVDRVLHNRGGVSAESRVRVQAILDEVGYKINLHTSAVALRKTFRLAITVPQSCAGEYWDKLLGGIRKATEEYSDIPISLEILPYDQFEPASCREVFGSIPDKKPDGVVIGPTFDDETHLLCASLEDNNIPYVFVDTTFPDTHPLSAFTSDQPSGGSLAGKLLDSIVPSQKSLALILPRMSGNGKSQNAEQRHLGFLRFFPENAPARKIVVTDFDFHHEDTHFHSFLERHPDLGGICILNSRGHLIADSLHKEGRTDIKVVAFDLTECNIRCLCEGSIFALICQRPERQGFLAVTTLLEHLLYHRIDGSQPNLMPLDIVLKENLEYYL